MTSAQLQAAILSGHGQSQETASEMLGLLNNATTTVRQLTAPGPILTTDKKLIFDAPFNASNAVFTLPPGVNGMTFDFGPSGNNARSWVAAATSPDTLDSAVTNIGDLSTGPLLSLTFLNGVWYTV